MGDNGPDYTDVFALRHSDWSISAARGDKLCGEFGLVHPMSSGPCGSCFRSGYGSVILAWLLLENFHGDVAR